MVARNGRPFYMDITTGEQRTETTSFFGLDFGTSDTSVSFVDKRAVQTFKRRSTESSWNELSDLSSSLPYFLAAPLAAYLCQTDPHRLAEKARDFVEAALTFAAYVTYLDHWAVKGRAETKLFKGLGKRSAGPLWNMFQSCEKQVGPQGIFSLGYRTLLEPEFFAEIDHAVSLVAQHKHGKVQEGLANVLRAVQILANISQQVFMRMTFGFFQQVQKERFGQRYEGLFRHAHGRPSFIESSKYSGTLAFSDNETYIVQQESRKGIS